MRRIDPRAGARAPNILLVHRFFDPDTTTYAQMLRHMAEHFAGDGFGVTVFTTQPGYNGTYDGPALARVSVEDGVCVRRLAIPGAHSSVGRLIGGWFFALALVLHVVRHRGTYDLVSVSTVPPVAMGAAGVLCKRLGRTRLVYHCMDLYPEIAIHAGLLREGWLARLASQIDAFVVRSADVTVVLSDDMVETLERRSPGRATGKIRVRNNFSISDTRSATSEPVFGPSERTRFVFAGNLGRFQGLEDLIDGFIEFLDRDEGADAELVFIGAGSAAAALRKRADSLSTDSIRFTGHLDFATTQATLKNCDCAIVSLSPGIVSAAFPSKTINYAEMGLRMLAVVEAESSLARLVEGQDIGVVAEPGNVRSIASAFEAEERNSHTSTDRERIRSMAEDMFGREYVLGSWTGIVKEALETNP